MKENVTDQEKFINCNQNNLNSMNFNQRRSHSYAPDELENGIKSYAFNVKSIPQNINFYQQIDENENIPQTECEEISFATHNYKTISERPTYSEKPSNSNNITSDSISQKATKSSSLCNRKVWNKRKSQHCNNENILSNNFMTNNETRSKIYKNKSFIKSPKCIKKSRDSTLDVSFSRKPNNSKIREFKSVNSRIKNNSRNKASLDRNNFSNMLSVRSQLKNSNTTSLYIKDSIVCSQHFDK